MSAFRRRWLIVTLVVVPLMALTVRPSVMAYDNALYLLLVVAGASAMWGVVGAAVWTVAARLRRSG